MSDNSERSHLLDEVMASTQSGERSQISQGSNSENDNSFFGTMKDVEEEPSDLNNSNTESTFFQTNSSDLYYTNDNDKSPSNETFNSNMSSLTEDQLNDSSGYIWKSAPFKLG